MAGVGSRTPNPLEVARIFLTLPLIAFLDLHSDPLHFFHCLDSRSQQGTLVGTMYRYQEHFCVRY